jgi:hypothetical protein
VFAASLRRLQVKVSKKKQKQTMSLADFNAGGPSATPTRAAGSAYRAPVGRSGGDDNFVLPTGPRAREDEEAAMGGALGGAFRDYGGDRGEGGKYGAPRSARRLGSSTVFWGCWRPDA